MCSGHLGTAQSLTAVRWAAGRCRSSAAAPGSLAPSRAPTPPRCRAAAVPRRRPAGRSSGRRCTRDMWPWEKARVRPAGRRAPGRSRDRPGHRPPLPARCPPAGRTRPSSRATSRGSAPSSGPRPSRSPTPAGRRRSRPGRRSRPARRSRWARPSGEVSTRSNSMSASRERRSAASARPREVSGMSVRLVCRPDALHSVSP